MAEKLHSDKVGKLTSVLNDRESLLSLYSIYSETSRFIVDKIWTNARFFTTLTSALIAFSVTVVVKVVLDEPNNAKVSSAYLFLLLLPIMVIIISYIGIKNLYREYHRFLDWVTVRTKLQERLGLCDEIKSQIYQEDKYLLPKRYVENSHMNSEVFIQSALKSRNSLYYYFKVLHFSYIAMALVLAAVMLYLGFGL
jgi:hypothetical protein